MPTLLLTPCVCVCGFVLLQSTLSATSIKLSYYLCVSGFALHVPDCVSTLFLCSYLCSFFTVFISLPPPPRSSLHHPFSTPLLPRCSNGSKPVSGQSRLQYGPNAQCLEPSLPGTPVPWPRLRLLWGLAVAEQHFFFYILFIYLFIWAKGTFAKRDSFVWGVDT